MGSFPNNYQRFPSIYALSNDTVAIVWESFPQDGDAKVHGIKMRLNFMKDGNLQNLIEKKENL